MPGAEIDGRGHEAAALGAAQAAQKFRKGDIAVLFGQQARRPVRRPLAAMLLKGTFRPVKQALRWKKAGRMHPAIIARNKNRTRKS